MNNKLSHIIFGFALFMFLTVPFLSLKADTLQWNFMDGDYQTLFLMNDTEQTKMVDPVSAEQGDQLRLVVYYHCGWSETSDPTEKARNTKVRINFPFTKENPITTVAQLWADNIPAIDDTGTINLSSEEKLILEDTAEWHREGTEDTLSVSVHDTYGEVELGDVACDCDGCYGNAGYVVFRAKVSESPNDPVTGSLNVSSNSVCVGETVSITLGGEDDNGMVQLKLMIERNGTREDTLTYDCSGTSCSKTWEVIKDVAGQYKLTAKFFGEKPDGTLEVYSIDDVFIEYKECPENHPPTANAGLDKEIYETESVVLEGSGSDPDGDSISYSWSCSGGTLSNSSIAQPVFYAPLVSRSTTYTCTLTVTDPDGLSDLDSMNVLVKEHQSPTLFVNLDADPETGTEPLEDVDLTARISGTAEGEITYRFDCEDDGDWDEVFDSYSETETAENICDLSVAGVYTAKVRVYREGLSATDTDTIEVSEKEEQEMELQIDKELRNLTKGQSSWFEIVSAKPSDKVEFRIEIESVGDATAEDLEVKDDLPENIAWQGDLKVDGKDFEGDITEGIEIGDLEPGQSETVSFEVLVESKQEFPFGSTDLTNTAIVFNSKVSKTDTAEIKVRRTAVAGAVTEVSTGVLSKAKISFFITAFLVLGISYALLLKSYLSQKMQGFEIGDFISQARHIFLGFYLSSEEKSKKELQRTIRQIRRKEGIE